MIMDMGTLCISEAELASDVNAILAEVQHGVEVVVEQDHRPVATIRTPLPKGRLLSESSRWPRRAAQPLSQMRASTRT